METETKTKTKVGRAENREVLRGAQRKLQETTDSLRDRVCTGPRYPGKPADYTYVLSESCRPKAMASAPRRPSTGKLTLPARQTRNEIKKLESALEVEFPPDHEEQIVVNGITGVVVELFLMMIAPDQRLQHPDPLLRYKRLIDKLSTRNRSDVAAKIISHIPRFMVLRLTLVHLRAILQDPSHVSTMSVKK